jgi:hypothetical protein
MALSKKAVMAISASILMALSAPALGAEKGRPGTMAPRSMVVKKAAGAKVRTPGLHSRQAPGLKTSRAGLRGINLQDRVHRNPGGIKLPGSGAGLLPEHVRRIKDRMAMERGRFRDRELGMKTPLPDGVDPRRVPGRGCPNRNGEEGLDTSYPPGDREREHYIAGVKQQWRESGVMPPEGMDENRAGLIEYEDGEFAWIEGDTRMGPDDENVTWGTLTPVDSDSGDEKGTKENAAAGDEDIMDEDAADIEKDPEPEGDDPDEMFSPTNRYRDAMADVHQAHRMQDAAQGDGRRGGSDPESDPNEIQRRKKLNDIWGATHVIPYAVAPVDPEDGGPDEAGRPVGEAVAALPNGYAYQPAPGGDDPDDPRAGGGEGTVRGRASFGEAQDATLTRRAAGPAFTPAIGDDGNPVGPGGPEF